MKVPVRPIWLRYLVAIAIVAAIIAIRMLLASHRLPGWEGPPLTMMLGGVMLASWFGGIGPGVLATLLGAAMCDYFFIGPRGTILGNELGWDIRLGLFVIEGCAISWLVQALRRSSAATRAVERNLCLIAQNTSDVIFAYDMSRQLLYVNPAFETLTGNTVNELAENPFMNYIHPDDSRRMQALFDGLFTGKSFSDAEYRIITHDGDVKWCRGSWGPLVDEFGAQIGVQGRETDITEEKRSEGTLRFLSEACSILASRSDTAEMLARITRAAVGQFADWCVIDILDAAGRPRTVAANHVDPGRQPWLHEIQRDYVPRLDDFEGRGKVLSTGQPIILPSVTDDVLSAFAQDARHLKLLRNLSPRTSLIVPIKTVQGRIIGAVTYSRSHTGRSYTADDLIFALDLSGRVATSIEGAREHSAAPAESLASAPVATA